MMDIFRPKRPNVADNGSNRWGVVFFGVILLVYALIAWQLIQAPLAVGDDTVELAYIRSKPSLVQLAQYDCFSFFRPVKNLLFWGFYLLLPFGMAACRLLAILIGLASAVAVHAMFRRLLRGPIACLSATACWLLAPTMLSCTAWLSCVNIQIMAGFAAVAVLLYVEARECSGAAGHLRFAGAWCASLMAMLCYEGAVCLPALFFLVDFYLYPERLRERRTWRAYFILGSTLLLYLLLRSVRPVAYQIQNSSFGEMTDQQVIVAAPWFFFQHLAIWLWPFGRQAIMGGYVLGQVPPLLLGCAWLGLAVLITGALLFRRHLAILALGVAWCLVAFLPMSNILAFRNGPYGDYYLALASMGLALTFGWGVGMLCAHEFRTRRWLPVLALAAVWRLAAAGESCVWSLAWNDSATIFRHTLHTFPRALGAITEYARVRYRRGEYDECQALTDQALALAPHNKDSYELRALVAEQRGNSVLAQKELDRFMQYGGTNESWGWYFQGHLLDEHVGDTNGAIRCYQQAIAHRSGWSPDVLDAMTVLGFFAATRGDRREAIGLWEQVVRIDPGRISVRQNLARAYYEAGESPKAQQQLDFLRQRNDSGTRISASRNQASE